jgi:hypothetical protein
MANRSNVKVPQLKVYIVLVSIIALFGILSLGGTSVYIASGQSVTMTQTQASDFVVVPIQQHLGDNKNDIFAPSYPYRGDVSDTFNFTIDGVPHGGGYLLVQIYGSYFEGHTIIINGQNVTSPGGNFGNSGSVNWATLTVLLDEDVLKQGQNSIQFLRNPNTEDNFLIDNVVVNWKYQLPQQQ